MNSLVPRPNEGSFRSVGTGRRVDLVEHGDLHGAQGVGGIGVDELLDGGLDLLLQGQHTRLS